MADLEPQRPRAELPPEPKPPPEGRSRAVLHVMRRRGWLRPRRIGCLLLVLVIGMLWVLGQVIDGVTDLFRPAPVAGSPLDTIALPPQASSGSPTIDRITRRGKLIVAIQEAPGLAQRSPGSRNYTGFDIALLDLIARDLGVDPAATNFKPLPGRSREAALGRGEADLVLGGYVITPQRRAEVDIAGPYLVRPLSGEPLGSTEYGIGLPRGDQVLRDRVTAVLRNAVSNGTWTRLYAQYFGAPAPDPPVLR